MTFRNPPTPHCHQDSLDTASTPEAFAEREIELGTGYLTCTDHGSMASCRRVYDLAAKKKLIPILGVEAYVRDDDCDILAAAGITKQAAKEGDKATIAHYAKYFHLTLHAPNQRAYERLVWQLSEADTRAERHGSERKPLFTWAQLEDLGAHGIIFTSGCLVGMVQRHLLDHDRADLALAYYRRLRTIAQPGNFYVELFPHRCDKNWDNAVYFVLEGGETLRFYNGKTLRTDSGEASAEQIARYPTKHKKLLAVKNRHTWEEREPKTITSVNAIRDYIPNECKPWAADGDVQLGANRFLLALAKRHGDPILISDDSHFAYPEDKIVQDCKLGGKGDTWKFYGSYHRQSADDSWSYFQRYMGITEGEFTGWVDSSFEWASRFRDFAPKESNPEATPWDVKVSLPTKFYPLNSLQHTKTLIDKHGRMDWSDQAMTARLKSEIALLHSNGTIDLLPYFFIGEEVCSLYREHGFLTGPGRGSAAGLLLTYLLGITHVNPLRYALSQDRFLTVDRVRSGKLPDIDQDLPNRELVEKWLAERFPGHYARISTDTALKVKSSMKDIARALHGFVNPEIEGICGAIPNTPQGLSDHDFVFGYTADDGKEVKGLLETNKGLQEYVEHYPDEWAIVQKMLGITRQKSIHACAFVIAGRPIQEFVPLTSVGDVKVTQYTAKSVEAVGGLKVDFLGLNSLNDISDCIKLIHQRHKEAPEYLFLSGRGKVPRIQLVPHPSTGEWLDVWDLPEDIAVFNDVSSGRTETVFQFNTNSARQWLKQFDYEIRPGVKAINSVEAMAAFTALDRPGPLDAMVGQAEGKIGHNMLVEYANRQKGLPSTDPIPFLDERLPETKGVMVYQEQLQFIYQELTGCTGIEANQFREDIAKKRMEKVLKAYKPFVEKAAQKIGEVQAEQLWNLIYTWGQYGFNKSHSVCYSVIAYACAYLKRNYPLEWWCAVLKNAKKDEIASKFWKHCGHLIDVPDIKLSGSNFEIQNERIRAPLSFLDGVGPGAQDELNKGIPFTSLEDFCIKREKTKDGKTKVVSTDEETGVQKKRRGTSSLNDGVVTKLILCGAMDGLFAADLNTFQKLEEFARISAQVMKKKHPAVIPAQYRDLHPFKAYQLRKQILPVYSAPLATIYLQCNVPNIKQSSRGSVILTGGYKGEPVEFVNFQDLERLEQTPVPDLSVAVAAYVQEEKEFTYKKGESRAVKYYLEVEGDVRECVAWPKRETGQITTPEGIQGALVIATFYRRESGRTFTLSKITVVEHPLKDKKEEESK
jgi:DNA-directed DNA polymerase III PolC